MATDYRNSSTPHTPSLQIAALVLTCINCLCGLALSTRILINAYRSRTTSRDIEKGGLRTSPGWWELLGGRELFPLVFGMAVGVHAAMLLLVQGVGMESGYGDCKAWASVAWTVVWIPVYIALVFANDAGLRATVCPRFAARSPRRCGLMMGVFLGLLALTWMPIWTRGWQAEGAVCTGELMGLMEPYADIGAALLAAACVVVGFMAITIIMALKRGMGEDLASASSEFYYFLVIGLPWVFILPSYITFATGNHIPALSFLAVVALSTTGPSTLLLHHHLQRNTTPPLPPKCPYSPTSTISPTLTITSAPLDLYSTSGSSFYPPSCPSTGHNSANSSVLNRLGEEITTFMSSLVGSRGSRISSTSDSPLLLTPTQPSLYAHFRPQSRNVQRNPARPSRYGVPDVNMGREQELGDSAGRQGMVRCLFEGSTSPREISVAPERGVGVGGRNSRREI